MPAPFGISTIGNTLFLPAYVRSSGIPLNTFFLLMCAALFIKLLVSTAVRVLSASFVE